MAPYASALVPIRFAEGAFVQHRWQPVEIVRDLTHDLTTDLAPRAARRSKASVTARVARLRSRAFFIVQCALAAGLSWWIAEVTLSQPTPYLAPIAAIICLGLTFGQRWRRIFEVTVGVAVGVFVGSAFAHYFGSGAWQIIVVTAIGMIAASLLGGGALLSTQGAVQGIVVMTLVNHPDLGFGRWFDAVIGALVAFVFAAIAPAAPIGRPRELAASIAQDVAGILRDAAQAYRVGDQEAAEQALERARATQQDIDAFAGAIVEGLAVVRHSPLRRRFRGSVQEIAALGVPLDRAVRNTRVLIRRISTGIWRHEPIDPRVLDAIDELARIIAEMSDRSDDSPDLAAWRTRLVAVGESTSSLDLSSLSSAVIIAQIRSIVVDVLEVTGLPYPQARELLREFDGGAAGPGPVGGR